MTLHFTPTSGLWLDLVEAFFLITIRQALRRGDFTTVADLIPAIERFIPAWNAAGRSPGRTSPRRLPWPATAVQRTVREFLLGS